METSLDEGIGSSGGGDTGNESVSTRASSRLPTSTSSDPFLRSSDSGRQSAAESTTASTNNGTVPRDMFVSLDEIKIGANEGLYDADKDENVVDSDSDDQTNLGDVVER